jgi:glycosyltransferase involved in cell wall biosynthesis
MVLLQGTGSFKMKKILFLTPFVPSKRAGGENYTRQLLEQLSQKNQIDLVYFLYGNDPLYQKPNDNIRIVNIIFNSLFLKIKHVLLHPFTHPIFSVRFSWRVLKELKELIAKNHYDVLYLDHTQMFMYGKYFPEISKVLMSHDVMAQRFGRSGNWLSRKMILCEEGKLMNMPKSTVFSFSEKDCKIIKDAYDIDTQVTNFFLDEAIKKAIPQKIEKRLVFFGKWNRADNFDGLKWFFDNVFNKIDSDFQIAIIGKWLPEDFQNKIATYSNVVYLGFVDNPYTIIANSWATLSPLFSGAGVKVKVIESLACGTPVIGNDISFEGISSQYKEFMINTQNADDFTNNINKLSISIQDRIKFKKMFLDNYQKCSITDFIEQI